MDPTRRRFLQARVAPAEHVRRPPWSLRPDDAFTARCTRCGDCVRACPREIVRMSEGAFPTLDLRAHGCSLCGECSRACTTGAIAPVGSQRPFEWQAAVDNRCLALRGVECRLCGDGCEPRALRFVPVRGGVAQLKIDTAACSGCGECLSVCPTQALSLVSRDNGDPQLPAGPRES